MADRVLSWFLDGHVSPGDSQGPVFELDNDYTPIRVSLTSLTPPLNGELVIDIDYTHENATTSIFTTPLPGIQKNSTVGERDYFVEPSILKAGAFLQLNVDVAGAGDGGRNLNVHLELKRI